MELESRFPVNAIEASKLPSRLPQKMSILVRLLNYQVDYQKKRQIRGNYRTKQLGEKNYIY